MIFRQTDTISFENYNLKPLDMYNGLSQVYCIKSEEKSNSKQKVKKLKIQDFGNFEISPMSIHSITLDR